MQDFPGVSELRLEEMKISMSIRCFVAPLLSYWRSWSYGGVAVRTKYHPVGPTPGIWSWEVRTTRTLGAMIGVIVIDVWGSRKFGF